MFVLQRVGIWALGFGLWLGGPKSRRADIRCPLILSSQSVLGKGLVPSYSLHNEPAQYHQGRVADVLPKGLRCSSRSLF